VDVYRARRATQTRSKVNADTSYGDGDVRKPRKARMRSVGSSSRPNARSRRALDRVTHSAGARAFTESCQPIRESRRAAERVVPTLTLAGVWLDPIGHPEHSKRRDPTIGANVQTSDGVRLRRAHALPPARTIDPVDACLASRDEPQQTALTSRSTADGVASR